MKRTVPSSSVCYFGRRPSPVGAALRSLGYLALFVVLIIAAAALATAGAMAASTLVMTLPTIIVYTVMQGRVLSTMAHSGIKA